MNDAKTTIQEVKDLVEKLIAERDWHQFHSPKNLSMSISVEAAELMEKFLWIDLAASHDEMNRNRKEIEDEAADVFMALICFCNASSIDLSAALERKLVEFKRKYPVEKSKGNSTKYDKL
jgi:dCTP diphosphatase